MVPGLVLSGTKTSVTYPAQDMGNTMLVGRWLDLQTAKASPRGALAQEVPSEHPRRIDPEGSREGGFRRRVGAAVRRQPQDHLQVAVALRVEGFIRSRRRVASAKALADEDVSRAGARNRAAPQGPSPMGTEEDRCHHGAAASGHAGPRYRDRRARAARRWLAAARVATAVRRALAGTGAPDHDRAERPVDRGLQRVVARHGR